MWDIMSPGDLWQPVDEVLGRDADVEGVFNIAATTISDQGQYRCAAKSDAGSFLANVDVFVRRKSFTSRVCVTLV